MVLVFLLVINLFCVLRCFLLINVVVMLFVVCFGFGLLGSLFVFRSMIVLCFGGLVGLLLVGTCFVCGCVV